MSYGTLIVATPVVQTLFNGTEASSLHNVVTFLSYLRAKSHSPQTSDGFSVTGGTKLCFSYLSNILNNLSMCSSIVRSWNANYDNRWGRNLWHFLQKSPIILHDNARARTTKIVDHVFDRCGWGVLYHLQYTPDISKCGIYSISMMK